jgi:hypothetical protein
MKTTVFIFQDILEEMFWDWEILSIQIGEIQRQLCDGTVLSTVNYSPILHLFTVIMIINQSKKQ